jgi:hypothetical protein
MELTRKFHELTKDESIAQRSQRGIGERPTRSPGADRAKPVLRPEGPAPKGQESLAQGLPWVSRNKRFALKGLEMCTRSSPEVRSRLPPFLLAPSGLIPLGELTQGKPWAMLFWPLRATDWNLQIAETFDV